MNRTRNERVFHRELACISSKCAPVIPGVGQPSHSFVSQYMNSYYVAAAFLSVAVGLAHSWLGERYILRRLFRRRDLPHLFGGDEFTRRTLRFAWHLTTVAWLGAAALLLVLASFPPDASTRLLSGTIAATFLASAVVALVGSRGRHLSWVAFLIIAGLVWVGSR